jgi:hypothetical protein
MLCEQSGWYTIVAALKSKRESWLTGTSMDADPNDMKVFPPLGPAIKVLMVWPRFPASFWSLGEVMQMVPERSLMPPLGLITMAALCPAQWEIRLVDLAFQDLRDEDILWADLVMVSAMAASA